MTSVWGRAALRHDTTHTEAHLDECSRCTGLYLELSEINSNLSGILGPALLGVAATGYLGPRRTTPTPQPTLTAFASGRHSGMNEA